MVTTNDVVKQMEARVGQNGSYYWKKYGLKKGTAWCAASVSASFADAGAKDKFYGGKPVFYVPYAQQWLKKNCKHNMVNSLHLSHRFTNCEYSAVCFHCCQNLVSMSTAAAQKYEERVWKK